MVQKSAMGMGFRKVDEGDEAVLDVGCLSGGMLYAWLSGRAFTPNFGFGPPQPLRRREQGESDAKQLRTF